MLVVGLLLLAAAVVVGVAGVAANTGNEHQLVNGFGIFGYHVHGSVGQLFLAGLVIGAVGMLGFIMATEGVRRNAELRRELFRFRRQARSQRRVAATAPSANDRVFARTAPAPSSDAVAADTDTSAVTAADTSVTDSAGGSGRRRIVGNWRTPRPTS